jgi:hypothetical protein
MFPASKITALTTVNLTVRQGRSRRYLTQKEIERLMDCARRHGRYGHRDATTSDDRQQYPRSKQLNAAIPGHRPQNRRTCCLYSRPGNDLTDRFPRIVDGSSACALAPVF